MEKENQATSNKKLLNPTKRFGNRVANYAKYRPGYPKEILNTIRKKVMINENIEIADIGSGTGIFTKLLFELDTKVYGIEPNNEMREYAENYLKEYDKFEAVNGTAEETTLEDESVDIVTAAQAFHWFELEPTKKEFLRVLKKGGHLFLVWNDRKIEESGFSAEYERIVREMCPDYNEVTHKNIDEEIIGSFYAPYKAEKFLFENFQEFDYEELKGRLMSSSYVPVDDVEKMGKILEELSKIFWKYQENGKIRFEYETMMYIGRIK